MSTPDKFYGAWGAMTSNALLSGVAYTISGVYNANDLIVIATANEGAPSGVVNLLAGDYDQAAIYTSPEFSGATRVISDIQGVRVQDNDGDIIISGTISGVYSVIDVKHGRGA